MRNVRSTSDDDIGILGAERATLDAQSARLRVQTLPAPRRRLTPATYHSGTGLSRPRWTHAAAPNAAGAGREARRNSKERT